MDAWIKLDEAHGIEYDLDGRNAVELRFGGPQGNLLIHATKDALAELVDKGGEALRALRAADATA